MKTTLGIDIGGSTTKIAGYYENGDFIGAAQTKAEDQLSSAYGALGLFAARFGIDLGDISRIRITGVGASKIKKDMYGIKTEAVDEFAATALGGQILSGRDRIIIASMGTGTAFVRADGREITHIGGTGVGGGMLAGLCRYWYNMSRLDTIIETAGKGSLDMVDLTLKDISDELVSNLPPDATAANFGKLSSEATKEDITLGLINTILQTVGMMAVFACRNDDIKTVVLAGAIAGLPQAKTTFSAIGALSGLEFIIPDNAVYATAIGAAIIQP